MDFFKASLTTSISKSFVTYSIISSSALSNDDNITSHKDFFGRFIVRLRSTSTQFSFCFFNKEAIGDSTSFIVLTSLLPVVCLELGGNICGCTLSKAAS